MTEIYTQSLNKLIDEFAALPGIGPKTAERLAFHILKAQTHEALALAKAISDVKNNISQCKICGNLCEGDICNICADQKRDHSIICIVEQPKDIINLEKTGLCKWGYHVLGGHIAPLEGVDPDDLNINSLVKRIQAGDVKEIVMATNPNMAGDGTALYICSLVKNADIKISRLARGLPTGSSIEFASAKILTDAIISRQTME